MSGDIKLLKDSAITIRINSRIRREIHKEAKKRGQSVTAFLEAIIMKNLQINITADVRSL